MNFMPKLMNKINSIGFLVKPLLVAFSVSGKIRSPFVSSFIKRNSLNTRLTIRSFLAIKKIFRVTAYSKIFSTIVERVAIDMVNYFSFSEFSAYNFFCDFSMQKELPTFSSRFETNDIGIFFPSARFRLGNSGSRNLVKNAIVYIANKCLKVIFFSNSFLNHRKEVKYYVCPL